MHRDFQFFRAATAVPPLRPAAVEENVAAIIGLAGDAAAAGADLCVFPELAVTGYTCADLFHQHTLLAAAEAGLGRFLDATAKLAPLYLVGLPVAAAGRVFNAAAVCQGGRILGVVPKTFLPNYHEFYEQRWFTSGAAAADLRQVRLCGADVPFGTDLLFQADAVPELAVGVELCEDLWGPLPPSTLQALAGATVLCNLSASNELVGKADYRRQLVAQQAARCLAAYVYSAAGPGESTTDLVFGGHSLLVENGAVLAESERFLRTPQLVLADCDLGYLLHERRQSQTFAESARQQARDFRRIGFAVAAAGPAAPVDLKRRVDPHPFVPGNPAERSARCEEIFAIQSTGLATRLLHTGMKRAVIGLSGGLDSTLALLVTVEAFRRAGLPPEGILGLTMPGFGTTERTLGNVRTLCRQLHVALEEIDITPACRQHLADLRHDGATGDIAYENAQARERTQLLMNKANMLGGLVVGTGDLSELALGWCTYNGDHMSMYGVNAGVPKTLVQYLVGWAAEHKVEAAAAATLRDILDTPISPELLPPDAAGRIAQKTESVIGPYELHDFFLYHLVRRGAPPEKILFLAGCAFAGGRGAEEIRKWLKLFLKRFFTQQFKRSCLPDGPKVGSLCLSPRGDWRMPSDAAAAAWLDRL